MVVWLFFCDYDNLTLKLHERKHSYPGEGWFFIGKFKVGNVPGVSVALVASKKSTKSHHEYDIRPLQLIRSIVLYIIVLFINKTA